MKPFIVGITGGSGAGKTSFINELKAQFSEQEICVISQDNYYRPREEQYYGWFSEKSYSRAQGKGKKVSIMKAVII